MGYYIDLKSISIDKYKEVLKSADLLPSRMILKENTNDNLDKLKNHNFQNLDDLQNALKDKSKLHKFSKQFDISARFLEVLRAEINGYLQKPNRIKDFSCVNEDITLRLEEFRPPCFTQKVMSQIHNLRSDLYRGKLFEYR